MFVVDRETVQRLKSFCCLWLTPVWSSTLHSSLRIASCHPRDPEIPCHGGPNNPRWTGSEHYFIGFLQWSTGLIGRESNGGTVISPKHYLGGSSRTKTNVLAIKLGLEFSYILMRGIRSTFQIFYACSKAFFFFLCSTIEKAGR